MSDKLTLDDLTAASKYGGPSAYSFRQTLETIDGTGIVAPSTYDAGRYNFQTRVGADGSPVSGVSIDSKASHLNRMEDGVTELLEEGHSLLSKVNRVQVTYPTAGVFTELAFPGKLFDTHIRAARDAVSGDIIDRDPRYIAASVDGVGRDTAMLEFSPSTRVLGAWESRRPHGTKFASIIRGETFGELADQTRAADTGVFLQRANKAGGWRSDPTMRGDLDKSEDNKVKTLVKSLAAELTVTAKTAKSEKASNIGLGNVGASGAVGVACRLVTRVSSINLALLRGVKLGGAAEDDIAVRRVLLAYMLVLEAAGAAQSHYRAGASFIHTNPIMRIDLREVPPLTLEDSFDLLDSAIAAAKGVPCGFEGNVHEAHGHPGIEELILRERDKGEDS